MLPGMLFLRVAFLRGNWSKIQNHANRSTGSCLPGTHGFSTMQPPPCCTGLRCDTMGLLRAGTLSAWLPHSAQGSPPLDRVEGHLSPLPGTRHLRPRRAAPRSGPGSSRLRGSARPCLGLGRAFGAEKEGTDPRPPLSTLYCPRPARHFPRGGAWSGRREPGRHPPTPEPSRQGPPGLGSVEAATAHRRARVRVQGEPDRTTGAPTYPPPGSHLSSNPEAGLLWKRKSSYVSSGAPSASRCHGDARVQLCLGRMRGRPPAVVESGAGWRVSPKVRAAFSADLLVRACVFISFCCAPSVVMERAKQ